MNIEQILKQQCSIICGHGNKKDLVNKIIKAYPTYEIKLPASFTPKKGLFKRKNEKDMYTLLEEEKAIYIMHNRMDYLSRAIGALELGSLAHRLPNSLSPTQKEKFGIIVDIANGKKDFLFYYEDIERDIEYFKLCAKWIFTVQKDARIVFVSNDTKKNIIQMLKNNGIENACAIYEYYNDDTFALIDINAPYITETEKNDLSNGIKFNCKFKDKTKLIEEGNTIEWMYKRLRWADVDEVYMVDCDSYKYDMTKINDFDDFIRGDHKEVTIYIKGKEWEKMAKYLIEGLYVRKVIDVHGVVEVKEKIEEIINENGMGDTTKVVQNTLPKEMKFDVSLILNNHPDSKELVKALEGYKLTSAEAINENNEKYSLLNKYRVLSLFTSFKKDYQIHIKGEDSIKATKAFLDYIYQEKMITMFSYNKLTQDYHKKDLMYENQSEEVYNFKDVKTSEILKVHKDSLALQEDFVKDKIYTILLYQEEPYQVRVCENKRVHVEDTVIVEKKVEKKVIEKEEPVSLTMNIKWKYKLSEWVVNFFKEYELDFAHICDHDGKKYNLLNQNDVLEYAETNNEDDVVTIAGTKQKTIFKNFINELYMKRAYSMLDYSGYLAKLEHIYDEREIEKEKQLGIYGALCFFIDIKDKNEIYSKDMVNVLKKYNLENVFALDKANTKYSLLQEEDIKSLVVAETNEFKLAFLGKEGVTAAFTLIEYMKSNEIISKSEYFSVIDKFESGKVVYSHSMDTDYIFIDMYSEDEIYMSKEQINFDVRELRPSMKYDLHYYEGKPCLVEKI